MSTIDIPGTVDDALASLTGLGQLLTAREWERAAIVYALTHGASAGGPRTGRISSQLTQRELSEKRISGLSDRETVARYHDAWDWAVGRGAAEPAQLGRVVHSPALEWPPNATVGERDSEMTVERRETLMAAGVEAGMPKGSKVVDIAANPKALKAAILADPKTAEVARQALSVRPAPVTEHRRQLAEDRRQEDDGKPANEGVVTSIEHLIDSERMDELVTRLVSQMRAGVMDNMPENVKTEAVETFRRWITALEWAVSIIEGGSITDDSIEAWLAS